ncbi:MAG: hypothetical protein V1711_03250 [bacterium]
MFEINQAARIMRAGNEFSETNKKLREAVLEFAEWLFEQVTECQLPNPVEFGWKVERLRAGSSQIRLSFKKGREWFSVLTNFNGEQMNDILQCCRALAGPEGERLIIWLEQQNKERQQMLSALQAAMQILRSSTPIV